MYKLIFKKFEATDFKDYFQLVSNEKVMVQITERAIPLEEAKVNYQKLLKRNEKYELYGSYKVYNSVTNEFIGLGHLTLNENEIEEAEIGYMILPEYWGKGYGSKIAKKLIELAKQTKLSILKAIIDPENIPSRKILIKQGFTSAKICKIEGLPGEILSKLLNQQKFIITQYNPKYAEQTVEMWRESKEQAIGQKEIHSFENHLYFLNSILPEQFQIDLALIDEQVVGMIAYNEREVSQLYIHNDYQGIGIGQTLLDKAKEQSSGRLTLYTFEVNEKAQQFYEKHGFNKIGRGHENEENLPDFQYEWMSK